MKKLNIWLVCEYPVKDPIVTVHLLQNLEPLAVCSEYRGVSEYSQFIIANNTDKFIKLIFLELEQFITSF